MVSSDLLRALRYVAMVEEGGGQLDAEALNAWMAAPSGEGLAKWARYEVPLDVLLDFAPGYAEYMTFVGWAEINPVRLTSVGRAVLKAAESTTNSSAGDDPRVIVLSPDDPMNALKATAAVVGIAEGLLVDPYFGDDLLSWLTEATTITRVLTCRREKDRRSLGMLLEAAASMGRELEIRCLPVKALHDRYLVDAEGAVSMMGASLNGLHANFTVVVPLPEPAAQAVRSYVESKWNEAVRVEPAGIRDEPDRSPEQ